MGDPSKGGGNNPADTLAFLKKGGRGDKTNITKVKIKSAEAIAADKAAKVRSLADKKAATEAKNILAAEKKAAADKAKAEKAEAKLIREREKLEAQKKAYEAAQAKAREQSEKAKESANA